MIQLLHNRLGGELDIAVVDEIALGRIDVAFDDHVKPERVAMKPSTFVALRKRRQIVGGFEVERLGQSHVHRDERS